MNGQPGYPPQAPPGYGTPVPPGPPPSPIPGWARWLGLGCGAVMLLGAIGSVLMFFVLQKATAGPEQTIQAFLAAAAAGDFQTAHGYFSEPLKQKQPYEQFAAVAGANQALFAATDTTFNSRSVDLAGAKLSGTITLSGGTELPASFELVREGSEWRLFAYQIGSGG
jgi:hypothetical protein